MQDSFERESRDKRLFDKVAYSYFSKELLPSASQARRWRVRQTIAQIPLTRIGRLLEPGCGAGFSAQYLEDFYDRYVGFDYSERLVALAEEANGAPNRTFLVGNARRLRLSERFDALLMIGVLHHIPDPGAALINLVRFLKPGGWVAINEPQRGNPAIGLARACRELLHTEYSSEQDQYHARELIVLLRSAGLKDVKVIPQGLFSTPFAEIKMPLQAITEHVARAACKIDSWLEPRIPRFLRWLSWNLIGVGRVA
jgi:SAM-dependent methyltransferase